MCVGRGYRQLRKNRQNVLVFVSKVPRNGLCLILVMSKISPHFQNLQNYILCLYFLTPVLKRKGLHVLKEVALYFVLLLEITR